MVFQYKTIITILLLSVSFAGIAQNEPEKEADLTKYYPRIVSLPEAEKKYKPSLPISTVEVFDARFDTSSVGLIQNSMNTKEKLIHFKHGTTSEIREYYKSLIILDSAFSNGKAITLVCFIKKLFLSDNIYVDGSQKVSSKNPVYEIKSGGMAMLEFYAKQDADFLPLYRFDTTVTGAKDVFNNIQNYIAKILVASLRKLEILNWEKIRSYSKPKNRFEIDSFNNARFNIPILKENPRKGIYLSFENFKNNTPLDSAFTVEKTNRGDFLYVKNKKGEDILQTELWGFSDGKNSYIYSAENYFKLSRYGNTFMIYGAKDFTSVRKLRLNFGLLDMAIPNSNYAKTKTVNSYKLILNLFQLDMESGELY